MHATVFCCTTHPERGNLTPRRASHTDLCGSTTNKILQAHNLAQTVGDEVEVVLVDLIDIVVQKPFASCPDGGHLNLKMGVTLQVLYVGNATTQDACWLFTEIA